MHPSTRRAGTPPRHTNKVLLVKSKAPQLKRKLATKAKKLKPTPSISLKISAPRTHLPSSINSLHRRTAKPIRSTSRHFSGSISEHVPDSTLFPLPPRYLSYLQESHKASLQDPSQFWLEQAKELEWFKPPTTGLQFDPANPHNHLWFQDGELNMTYLGIDKHIKDGYGEETAFIHENVYLDRTEHISYSQLSRRVNEVARALVHNGIKKGDHVMLYMPMVVEAAVVLLACARIGAVTSCTFGGFGSSELSKRLNAFKPRILFTASCGLEPNKIVDYGALVNGALEIPDVHVPEKIVHLNRPEGPIDMKQFNKHGKDVLFNEFINTGDKTTVIAPVPMKATDPLYVCYTSGTTSAPKGVVRDTGGYATALKYSLKHVYGVKPGETWAALSEFSWVVGLSYTLFAPLLNRNTSLIFEGKPTHPTPNTFFRLMAKHKVKAAFLAPTAIRAIKSLDPTLSQSLQYQQTLHHNNFVLWLAGERSDRSSLHWLTNTFKIPVIDHFWQTELGWPTTALSRPTHLAADIVRDMDNFDENPFSTRFGSAGYPVPGWDYRLLDDAGNPITTPEKEGYLAIKTPLPPGFMHSLHSTNGDNERYNKYFTRFPGYYDVADGGYFDKDGLVYVTGRTDDVFNVAGHRLTTSSIEEAVSSHPCIAESIVIPLPDNQKGALPLVLATKKSNNTLSDAQIEKEIIALVRKEVGPVASPKKVLFTSIPKTRSGKALRGTVRQIINYLIYCEQHKQHPEEFDLDEDRQTHKFKVTPIPFNDDDRAIYKKMVPFPSTIEDASVLDLIEKQFVEANIVKDSLSTEDVAKIH